MRASGSRATEASANINPSNTNDVVGEYARASAAEAERAIAAAKDAFPAWSRSSIQQRHDILKAVGDEILARKEELGRLLSREEGKTLPEGIGEVTRAGQIFLFFSGECLRMAGEKVPSVRPGIDVEITREPVGVVGLITPWNFPIAIPAWKIAPALAYGNTRGVQAGRSGAGLGPRAVRDHHPRRRAGGRVQPRHGPRLRGRRGDAEAARRCPPSPSPARSRRGARSPQTCITADPMKKVQLEMGGKNPLVVLDDADLKVAVECAVNGAFFSTGQRCTASSRLIVTEGIHDQLRRPPCTERHAGPGRRRCLEGRHAYRARSSTRASSTRT